MQSQWPEGNKSTKQGTGWLIPEKIQFTSVAASDLGSADLRTVLAGGCGQIVDLTGQPDLDIQTRAQLCLEGLQYELGKDVKLTEKRLRAAAGDLERHPHYKKYDS